MGSEEIKHMSTKSSPRCSHINVVHHIYLFVKFKGLTNCKNLFPQMFYSLYVFICAVDTTVILCKWWVKVPTWNLTFGTFHPTNSGMYNCSVNLITVANSVHFIVQAKLFFFNISVPLVSMLRQTKKNCIL